MRDYDDRVDGVRVDGVIAAVCGGEITKEYGMLSSPNYPDLYKASKNCVWKITVPDGYTVALKFQSFEVQSIISIFFLHLILLIIIFSPLNSLLWEALYK